MKSKYNPSLDAPPVGFRRIGTGFEPMTLPTKGRDALTIPIAIGRDKESNKKGQHRC